MSATVDNPDIQPQSFDNNVDNTDINQQSQCGNLDPAIEEKRIRLEERKIKLEELKETHLYDIALRKELFQEEQIEREYRRQVDRNNENWFKSYWRPTAGWLYMFICFMDFVVFPAAQMAMWALLTHTPSDKFVDWSSLTLTNGGIFHVAMGAVLGIAAYTRSAESVASIQAPTAFRE